MSQRDLIDAQGSLEHPQLYAERTSVFACTGGDAWPRQTVFGFSAALTDLSDVTLELTV